MTEKEGKRAELLHETIDMGLGKIGRLASRLHLSVTTSEEVGIVDQVTEDKRVSLAAMLKGTYKSAVYKRCEDICALLRDIEDMLT